MNRIMENRHRGVIQPYSLNPGPKFGHPNADPTVYEHRTLKAAFRRLGSCISGKLAVQFRGISASHHIITPDGRNLPWLAARNIIQARSEERRLGKECVSTCRSRGAPDH